MVTGHADRRSRRCGSISFRSALDSFLFQLADTVVKGRHQGLDVIDHPGDGDFPVDGMPNARAQRFVDYALRGAESKPLAVPEAKRTKKDGDF